MALAIVGPRTGFKVIRARSEDARERGRAEAINSRLVKDPKNNPSGGGGRAKPVVGMNPDAVRSMPGGARSQGCARPKKIGVRALSIQGVGWRASAGPVAGVHFIERSAWRRRSQQIVSAMTREIMAGLAKQGR